MPEGNLNLRDCELQLKVEINSTGDAGVHNCRLGNGTKTYPVHSLIKNCKLINSGKDVLEEIQNYNVLACNQLQVVSTKEDQDSSVPFGNYTGAKMSDFRELGLTASVERKPLLHIPIRNLFGFFNQTSYNTNKNGRLIIQLELEDIANVVAEEILYTAVAPLACDDVVSGGAVISTIKTTATAFETENKLTLWAGCTVRVAYTDTAGAQTEDTKITEVATDATGKMKITLADDLGNANITAVSLSQTGATALNYNVSDVNAKVYTTMMKEPAGDKVFRSWEAEAFSKPATTNYQRDYDLPPNTMNAFIMPKN